MAAPYNLAPVSVAHAPGERVATRIYWLMACAEHEVSWDLGNNGLFSRSLFRVMDDGSASKTTSAVMREVAKECRPDQTPRWSAVNGTGGRKVW